MNQSWIYIRHKRKSSNALTLYCTAPLSPVSGTLQMFMMMMITMMTMMMRVRLHRDLSSITGSSSQWQWVDKQRKFCWAGWLFRLRQTPRRVVPWLCMAYITARTPVNRSQ